MKPELKDCLTSAVLHLEQCRAMLDEESIRHIPMVLVARLVRAIDSAIAAINQVKRLL